MALSLFGFRNRRAAEDPFDAFFSDSLLFPSFPISSARTLSSFSKDPGFARDVAAVANTQVDWKETDDSHVFKANLPGLSKEEVKVQVEEWRVLQISGERKKEETKSTDRWHWVERSRGSFLRRFRLPENTMVDEVKAAMENGVLTVTVPKAPPPEPKSAIRTIDISSD